MKNNNPRKNWKVWKLYDSKGNLLASGSRKHVTDVLYPRYVYCHIFTDTLIRTNEPLYR